MVQGLWIAILIVDGSSFFISELSLHNFYFLKLGIVSFIIIIIFQMNMYFKLQVSWHLITQWERVAWMKEGEAEAGVQ